MVTFAVHNTNKEIENKEFIDMYELLAYVSGYIHTQTEQENKLASQLEQVRQEDQAGPFDHDEAKQYLDTLVSGK